MFEKFFNDPSFDFETRTLFGEVHYGAGDVGEMLTVVASITDGEAASWVGEWRTLAERTESIADTASKAGHKVSARNAYLRAAVYYAASSVFVDGTENAGTQLGELFAAHRKCFDLHVGLLDPPAIPISVPYERSDLPGYLLIPAADGVARPTLILNNGSDGAHTFLWPGWVSRAWTGATTWSFSMVLGSRACCSSEASPSGPIGSTSSPRWWTS